MAQKAANQIDADQWTLFDKIMYGGLGYGSFCLPTDFYKVIISIIFPPLGELINIIEDTISNEFPYFSWHTLVMLCSYNAITHLVYSLVLTTLFYTPGLVYTLTNIVNKERRVTYDTDSYIYANPKIRQPSSGIDLDDVANTGELVGSEIQSAGEIAGDEIQSAGETVGSGIESIIDDIGSLF
jgi:uncharacterized membrane protein YqaE (UPF0057 family)/uncharacterized protein YuzE